MREAHPVVPCVCVHPAVPGTRVQPQHLILLEPGFAEILLNMNALALLPLIPTSISKLLIPRLFQNRAQQTGHGGETAPTSSNISLRYKIQ